MHIGDAFNAVGEFFEDIGEQFLQMAEFFVDKIEDLFTPEKIEVPRLNNDYVYKTFTLYKFDTWKQQEDGKDKPFIFLRYTRGSTEKGGRKLLIASPRLGSEGKEREIYTGDYYVLLDDLIKGNGANRSGDANRYSTNLKMKLTMTMVLL